MKELQSSASSFFESSSGLCLDAVTKHISLSMIFKWYKEDYESHPNKANSLF